jgi:hypothetical protein
MIYPTSKPRTTQLSLLIRDKAVAETRIQLIPSLELRLLLP